MSTPTSPTIPPDIAAPGRAALRLRLAEPPGSGYLGGGWWPHSRDLAVELADLVDHFPPRAGRIVRALVSPPDWDSTPRRIPIARGFLKVGSFPRDDTHLVLLTTSDRTVLRVLVVPPGFTRAHGEEALLTAASAGNTLSANDVLEEFAHQPATGPMDRWTDDGGSWWGPGRVTPAVRTGG